MPIEVAFFVTISPVTIVKGDTLPVLAPKATPPVVLIPVKTGGKSAMTTLLMSGNSLAVPVSDVLPVTMVADRGIAPVRSTHVTAHVIVILCGDMII